MNKSEFLGGVLMRVSVGIGSSPVGGPAGVADPGLTLNRVGGTSLGQLLNPTAFLAYFYSLAVEDG